VSTHFNAFDCAAPEPVPHQQCCGNENSTKKVYLIFAITGKTIKIRGLFPGSFFLPQNTEQRPYGVHIGEHILMPSVKVRDNEPFDFALRRFKRACEKAGILAESRKRQYYEKPTQERKRKKAAAVKRLQRRVAKEGIPRRMY